MTDNHLEQSSPGRLAQMLGVVFERDPAWTKDELGSVLAHQLDAPLRQELVRAFGPEAARNGRLVPTGQGPAQTFAGVLFDTEPDVVLLVQIKEFAKTQRATPQALIPRNVATVIYLLSIAAALVHGGERITSLQDPPLREAFEWALRLSWIDDNCSALLSKAALRLHA